MRFRGLIFGRVYFQGGAVFLVTVVTPKATSPTAKWRKLARVCRARPFNLLPPSSRHETLLPLSGEERCVTTIRTAA